CVLQPLGTCYIDSLFELGHGLDRPVTIEIERQPGPAEMLQIAGASGGMPTQVLHRPLHTWVVDPSLYGQKHKRGRRWDRLEWPAKHAAVAVVDTALGQCPVEEQL